MRLKVLTGSVNPLTSSIQKVVKQGDPKEYFGENSSISKLGLDEAQALTESTNLITPSTHCLTEAVVTRRVP